MLVALLHIFHRMEALEGAYEDKASSVLTAHACISAWIAMSSLIHSRAERGAGEEMIGAWCRTIRTLKGNATVPTEHEKKTPGLSTSLVGQSQRQAWLSHGEERRPSGVCGVMERTGSRSNL